MRLEPETVAGIDEWRERRDPVPSRAAAVRTLVEDGLERAGQPVLGDGEKLILGMLCDLFVHLKISSEFDPAFIKAALTGGHHWALAWEYPGLFDDREDHDSAVEEVVRILEMWRFLESGHAALPAAGKAEVERGTGRSEVRFPGFDGNYETGHMGIARFLVDTMGRFPTFAGRGDFNSHWPMLDLYRRMLEAFEPMRRGLVGREMSAREIVAVLKAGD